jgi:hypothetical protein
MKKYHRVTISQEGLSVLQIILSQEITIKLGSTVLIPYFAVRNSRKLYFRTYTMPWLLTSSF